VPQVIAQQNNRWRELPPVCTYQRKWRYFCAPFRAQCYQSTGRQAATDVQHGLVSDAIASHRPAVNGIAVVGSSVAGHGDSYLLVATNKLPMIVNIVSQSEAEAVVACEVFRNGGYSMAREVTRGSAENAAIIGIKRKRNES
jgi:hypothetical protein